MTGIAGVDPGYDHFTEMQQSMEGSMADEITSRQAAEAVLAKELAERMFVEWEKNRSGAVIVPRTATVSVLELAAELFSQRADRESQDMKYEAELVIGARNPFRGVPRPSYFTFHRG